MCDILFKPKLLNRRRIKKMFDYIFDRPLFLIIASTGYGKTISLRRFLNRKKDVEQIWFSLGTNETDDIWIWQKLCAIIYKTYPNSAQKLSNYNLPQKSADMEYFISILKQYITRPTVFVIDDFQEIKNNGIDLLIENLTYSNIPNLHIVVISRIHPRFAYDELILKGYCYIMEQCHIAFNLEETKEFFALNGFILDKNELDILFNYTDGWVSATYLALLCYEKDNNFDNLSNCYQLIKTAVYDKFDDETKKILMTLSPLDSFTLNQALAITQNKKTINILRQLTTNNCFIKYDHKSGIYNLHIMLKMVANKGLEYSDIDILKVFELCGEWYLQNGQDISAIEFYHKAKKYDNVLNIVEHHLQYELLNQAPTIIINVFDDITIEQKLKHPLAYILFIQFYMFNIDTEKGKALLYQAKLAYESDESIQNKNQILGEIALIERITCFNDIHEMDKCLDRAYNLFNGNTSKIYNSSAIFNFASPHNLSLFHTKKNKLYEIVENVETNFWKYNCITNYCAAGYEYLIRAEYCYETGDNITAELLAYKARFKAKAKNQQILVCSATFTLMRIAILNGKFEDLNDYISELEKHIMVTDKTFLTAEFDIMIGYIYACIGQVDKIPLWLQNYNVYTYNSIQSIENIYIIYAKTLILKKDFSELETFSETMLAKYRERNNIFGMIISKIFTAVSKYNLYSIDEATPPLIEAIELAECDNIVMSFAENGLDILPILYKLKDAYAQKLVTICEKFNSGAKKIYDRYSMSHLTERELEIMDLVSHGYKNAEIAQHLSVALVTIEKTLSSVYKKLNVKNRVSAVASIKNCK